VSWFESAVDAVVSGNLAALDSLLGDHPELVHERSAAVHRATLLHYTAANGVEEARQRTPANAVSVAEMLLRAGAEVDALAGTYGGGTSETTLNLLVCSWPPAEAGVQAALIETLLDFGAAIEGVEGDGSPLITALAFGYTEAAETLARRGARVETVVAAAGLGREDLVQRMVDRDGRLHADVPLVHVHWLRVSPEQQANLELALTWASVHRRTGVAEFLLRHGVPPGARDQWGMAVAR